MFTAIISANKLLKKIMSRQIININEYEIISLFKSIFNTIYFFINLSLKVQTIIYDMHVAIAAPWASNLGINIKFKIIFDKAPIAVDFAYIFESLFAAYIDPKNPDNAPNKIASKRNGTYFHAPKNSLANRILAINFRETNIKHTENIIIILYILYIFEKNSVELSLSYSFIAEICHACE